MLLGCLLIIPQVVDLEIDKSEGEVHHNKAKSEGEVHHSIAKIDEEIEVNSSESMLMYMINNLQIHG